MKRRMFINSTLSSSEARDFNIEVANLIRSEGFEVFLPQEMLPPGSGISSIRILEENEKAIERSDVMISVLDYSPGLGVAYELGYAQARRKTVILFRAHTETNLGEILEGFWNRMEKSRKAENLQQLKRILREIIL